MWQSALLPEFVDPAPPPPPPERTTPPIAHFASPPSPPLYTISPTPPDVDPKAITPAAAFATPPAPPFAITKLPLQVVSPPFDPFPEPPAVVEATTYGTLSAAIPYTMVFFAYCPPAPPAPVWFVEPVAAPPAPPPPQHSTVTLSTPNGFVHVPVVVYVSTVNAV